MNLFFLFFFAFLAGFVDAVGGGGGLIQVPALFIFSPTTLSHATLLGTNKFAGCIGTSAAAVTYARRGLVPWRFTIYCSLIAACFSFLGSRLVSSIPPENFKPIILVLLVLVAIFTFTRKNIGQKQQLPSNANSWIKAAIIGSLVGFYDGFFGPGTGSFFIFLFVVYAGLSFLAASAAAKVVNVATNVGSLLYFIYAGNVLYSLALPMAACSLLGGVLGARAALNRGNTFVRKIFIAVVLCFILKLAWDLIFP